MEVAAPDYATFVWDHRIIRYFFLEGLVIMIYDHALTFGTEVKYIWSSKLRLSTIWFLLVRYVGLASNIVITLFYFGNSNHETCVRMQLVWEVLLVLQEVLVEVTLFVRVFAMYGLSLWILAGLLCTGCVSAVLALWAVIEYGTPKMLAAPGLAGCHGAFPRTTHVLFSPSPARRA
ncbi:hypothetical protein GGX14DRAFT_454431 [Mycena pura]|uniref:DUF6533 domain-containing protein n=1 Tax=Mycena pura TaxID=153505 RepID=A0AAD6VBP1_9AGAR|nr:hypothetical protein GGX14DRAFT_454431 [Mycena pura]